MTFELSAELREALQNLGQCLLAMGKYRKQSVLAGGLATIVYRYLQPEIHMDRPPLLTFDADMGLAYPLEQAGEERLSELMISAGFEVYTAGEGNTKAYFYKHRDQNPGGFFAYSCRVSGAATRIRRTGITIWPGAGTSARSGCTSPTVL